LLAIELASLKPKRSAWWPELSPISPLIMTSQRSIAPISSTPVLDWESHKNIIEELYIKKDRPLSDVRQELEKWYAFEAR
jgi:hypothetical protein